MKSQDRVHEIAALSINRESEFRRSDKETQKPCTGGNMEQELRSEGRSQTEEPLLTLTSKAVAVIKQTMEQQGVKTGGVRMTVEGGGCKGFLYSLTLAEAAHTDDKVVVQDGVKAFLDPVSAQHLRGTLLDYVSNRHGTGFHFFQLDASLTMGCRSPILLRRCIEGNTRTSGCEQSAKRPLLKLEREVAQPRDTKASVAHPGLRPMSICPQCRYVKCRCEEAA